MCPPFDETLDCHKGAKPLLELLLFIEWRATAKDQIQQVRDYLDALDLSCSVKLHVVEVSDQPYLVEYYRLVVTPALVKIHPEPTQVLAGSNLLAQLQECWPHWRQELEDLPEQGVQSSLARSTQIMKLSDEIFRLNQQNEAMQEQLKFKDRIVAMLAHDLRNPLTAAAIAIETLEGQWDLENSTPLSTETLIKLSDHARTQIRLIERMITGVLEASQRKSVTLDIRPKKLNLVALCQVILDDLSHHFLEKSQSLETDLPADLPWVHGDIDQVRQVLINLLENAVKYTPSGGTIHISALHRTTQKVQVSICDNGPGIPEEQQKYIFVDRFRLKRDQAQKGYGIGLSLCQQIVQAHYGKIWVESSLDEGSCFHFTLPVYHF
jgi:two-component system, OmpR family, clock-associated histidine kinase SasA